MEMIDHPCGEDIRGGCYRRSKDGKLANLYDYQYHLSIETQDMFQDYIESIEESVEPISFIEKILFKTFSGLFEYIEQFYYTKLISALNLFGRQKDIIENQNKIISHLFDLLESEEKLSFSNDTSESIFESLRKENKSLQQKCDMYREIFDADDPQLQEMISKQLLMEDDLK